MVEPAAGRPSECPFRLPNRMLVDAGKPSLHQTIGRKFPILIAVGTEPITAIVVVFTGIWHDDAPIFVPEMPASLAHCRGNAARLRQSVSGMCKVDPRRVTTVPTHLRRGEPFPLRTLL